MTSTSTFRIEGSATLLSSVAHGGDHAGTTQLLRRERIIQPDGSVAEVPVISGNALRGILRDHSATHLWHMLGEPELPFAVFHVLWSGGALAKAGSGHVLGSRQLRELRSLVPHVSLFGAAGGGRIIEGRLLVGKLMPICAETRHIVPAELLPETVESIWQQLQIEEFSRMDDAKMATKARPLAGGGEPPALEAGGTMALLTEVQPEPAAEEASPGPAQQMRYGIETIGAGARLHWWMQLRDVSSMEVATFAAAIRAWSADGGHVGGRSATGHGRLQLRGTGLEEASPRLTLSSEIAPVSSLDALRGHIESHRAEIVEALGWLG